MGGLPVTDILPAALTTDSAGRLSALFDDHYERLYCLARRLVSSGDDARDLVQETFLRAARSLASVPKGGPAEEEAWLVRVLVNVRRDEWRRAAVRRRHEEASGSSTIGQGDEAAFVARATVWRALDTLTPRRRAVVVMRELEGLAVPDIARMLGVSAVTVRWHLARARRDLARILGSHLRGRHEDGC